MKDHSGYKNIFKSTLLFGFVQIFNILVKVIINKVIAILLGAQGIGTIGLFNNTINFLKVGIGLGISQSAVREISDSHGSNNILYFAKTISITQKIISILGLLGIVVTIILSPYLSKWTFGNNLEIISFMWLSLLVGANIVTEGQLAILKGMRRLKDLAKASLFGALIGLIGAIPLYFLYGFSGIVPSLIIAGFASLVFSNYYVRKISYLKVKLKAIEIIKGASLMTKMGSALMMTTFISSLVALVVVSYIKRYGSLSEVGYYQAGITLMQGYFGIVITALTTDYFPRISAISRDNEKLSIALNQQSLVCILLMTPLFVGFIVFLPFFIRILYSSTFYPTTDYVRFAVVGMLITATSNQIDMILIAKFKVRLFLLIAIPYRILDLGLSLFLYNKLGLFGLGIACLILGVVHMCLMSYVVYYLYQIKLTANCFKFFCYSILVALFTTIIIKDNSSPIYQVIIGGGILFMTTYVSYRILRYRIGINIFKLKDLLIKD